MFRHIASAFLATALFCGSASSAPVTVYFSGQISSIISDDSSNTFSSNFAVGNTVTGSWTFDSAATGTAGGGYSFYAASFIANIGASTFSGAAEYRIFDGPLPGGDGFSVINETSSYSGPALGPLTPRTFFLQFLGMPTSTLASTALIADPAALVPQHDPLYAPHGFRLDNPDGSFGGAYFRLDSVTAAPEPAAFALAGLGLALVAGVRCRKR